MHQPVDPARARLTEQLDLLVRQLVLIEHSGAHSVVDVVIDVRDAVDDPDDLPLERGGFRRARVVEDSVADLVRQVEPAAVALDVVDDAQRVLVVAKPAAEVTAELLVEALLAGVAEGRVAEVVPEADRLHEVLVQPEGARDPA